MTTHSERKMTAEDGLKDIANVLQAVFVSPNETDSNWEDANVVDGLFAIARSIQRLASVVEGQEFK